MSKLNPTIKQTTIDEITQAAALLPEVMGHTKKTYTMTGAELLLLNKKTVGGKPIEKDRIYTVNLPEYKPLNHKDEMIKIYTDTYRTAGHEQAYKAVCDYINDIWKRSEKKPNHATKKATA